MADETIAPGQPHGSAEPEPQPAEKPPEMKEFECRICLDASESRIRLALEKALPSLKWEEGDSSWDKIRVWGTNPDASVSVYRYESPGPFKLTIRLRTREGADSEQAYLALRERVLLALNGKLWKPLEPQPVTLIKPDGHFPAAYEFETDLGMFEIKNILDDSELWHCEANQRRSGDLSFGRIRLLGERPHYRVLVGHWLDEPGRVPTCEQVHETVQTTILPALGARNVRAPATKPLEPQPISLIKPDGQFLAAYEFESDLVWHKIENILADSDLWHFEPRQGPFGDLYFGPIRLLGDPPQYKMIVDHSQDANRVPAYEQVHETVQTTILPALRAHNVQATTATAVLITILKTAPDHRQRFVAAEELGKIGSDAHAAIPALIEALRDQNNYVRNCAVQALGLMGPAARQAIRALLKALWDKDERVPECVIEALGRIGSAAVATQVLITMLKTAKSPRRRCTAAQCLGKIGHEAQAAIPALIEALRDGEPFVRRFAAEALGRMGPAARQAIPVLQELLSEALVHNYKNLAETARKSLAIIQQERPSA